LHSLYRRKRLEMQLIDVWCFVFSFCGMQYEDERKTSRYKVGYCNPALINQREHSLKMTNKIKALLEAATTEEEKETNHESCAHKRKI
ncbi:hypothetical protein BAE44_0021858, partial [Dichanthelium oligosanthes]